MLANPWIPHDPTEKQVRFLLCEALEAFYGGAAGGGKSDALLMAALQYADVPGYAAILFRRSYTDLALPGALMDRCQEWLGGSSAHWKSTDKTWQFPSGASLSFGYLEHENDKYRYQGAEFQFVGFDETTQFSESQYRFLFSRLRRIAGSDVPLRMRAASNPGGVGHEWVRRRFVDADESQGRVWIRATLNDNPFLDRDTYARSLSELDPVTLQQLLHGDWSARQGGGLFRREWFEVVDAVPAGLRRVRYWDLASTEPVSGKDPDWTVGLLLGVSDIGMFYVLDVARVRASPSGVEAAIKQKAMLDGTTIPVWVEQEPGSSGVNTIDHYVRRVLPGWAVRGHRSTGSKVERSNPVSSQAEAGNIKLVRGPWVNALLDELEGFPEGSHDDQVDALSGAFIQVRGGRPGLRILG